MVAVERRVPVLVFLAALVALALVFAWAFYPVGVDWRNSYSPALHSVWQPYDHSDFAGFPWLLLCVPHALLPLAWGNAANLVLNVSVLGAVIWVYRGGWPALLLTFTSPVFLDLLRTNNVDWVPALAFLLPPTWGLPLLAAKPQTLGGAALIWWKRSRFSARMLLPVLAVGALSFVVWPGWMGQLGMAHSDIRGTAWNFAPWPFAIPLGLYLLVRAYKLDDEVLAAAATPLLVPYFAPYSLTPLLALLACRHRTAALYLYFGLWFYLIVESRRIAAM
ncbi:hypothetical protein [Aggregatilinea lenta]|uniref:hypothetical protein n=1 Tax=Aggregatilinea lenta TaxID=913108 RepID=UPI0013C31A5A|nr:hypothetical protein [Aggregatilinea lenta]